MYLFTVGSGFLSSPCQRAVGPSAKRGRWTRSVCGGQDGGRVLAECRSASLFAAQCRVSTGPLSAPISSSPCPSRGGTGPARVRSTGARARGRSGGPRRGQTHAGRSPPATRSGAGVLERGVDALRPSRGMCGSWRPQIINNSPRSPAPGPASRRSSPARDALVDIGGVEAGRRPDSGLKAARKERWPPIQIPIDPSLPVQEGCRREIQDGTASAS